MDTLLRFGDGGLAARQYTFTTDNQVSLSTNFADAVTQTARILGTDGGFNQYGAASPPGAIGSISYTFWLYFSGSADAKNKLDALQSMRGWGLQRLYMQPQDATVRERFCYAMVNNVTASFNARDVNHRRMRVTVTFHVPTPFWYAYPFDVTRLDYGEVMSASLTMAGWAVEALTADTTINLTVGGTATARPVLRFDAGATGQVDNLVIVRRDRDTLKETHRIEFSQMIDALDRLVIDAAQQRIVFEDAPVGNVDGWQYITRTRAGLIELQPGVNQIEISGDFTNTVNLSIEYLETYR